MTGTQSQTSQLKSSRVSLLGSGCLEMFTQAMHTFKLLKPRAKVGSTGTPIPI